MDPAACAVSGHFAGARFVYCNTFEYPNNTFEYPTRNTAPAACAHTQCEGKLGLAVYAVLSERCGLAQPSRHDDDVMMLQVLY